jgi:hypothetical protein
MARLPSQRLSLECTQPRRFFSRVHSSRIQVGVRAGLVAAAATAGAIIGFGIRHHDWSGPFVSLGTKVVQGFGVSRVPGLVPSAAGFVAHVAWMVLWGMTFAAFAYRRTLRVSAMLAVLVGVGAALTAQSLIPEALGAVRFAELPGAQAALCVVLMTLGLMTGRALSSAD